jgi:hypothetical protein
MRFGLLLLACLSLGTQAPPTAAPFSELEQAKLQAIAYEGAAIDADQRTLDLRKQLWQSKVAAFKAAAESTRKGFTWDPDSGKWSEKK